MTHRKQKTVAAMRRQVSEEIVHEKIQAWCRGDYVYGLRWVLDNVLTTPNPNRKRGGK